MYTCTYVYIYIYIYMYKTKSTEREREREREDPRIMLRSASPSAAAPNVGGSSACRDVLSVQSLERIRSTVTRKWQ